jgi:hypothetical protein
VLRVLLLVVLVLEWLLLDGRWRDAERGCWEVERTEGMNGTFGDAEAANGGGGGGGWMVVWICMGVLVGPAKAARLIAERADVNANGLGVMGCAGLMMLVREMVAAVAVVVVVAGMGVADVVGGMEVDGWMGAAGDAMDGVMLLLLLVVLLLLDIRFVFGFVKAAGGMVMSAAAGVVAVGVESPF